MTHDLNRRTLLKAALGSAGLSAFGSLPGFRAGCPRPPVLVGIEGTRRPHPEGGLAVPGANTGVKIDGETLAWGDYWPRLATQAAGRNAPDLIQMDYRYVAEYARRGALLPLDEFIGKSLDISDFDKASLDSCKVDGKLYGINSATTRTP